MRERRISITGSGLAVIALGALAGCTPLPQPVATARPNADLVEVGYGAVAQRKVTGAVASLSRAQIDARAGSGGALSVLDLLYGMSGVSVLRRGGDVSLRVRSAMRDPLIVVDGTALSGAATDVIVALRATDVERIDVLQDGGSTASYGARGSGGVILIRTRRR
jgi:TonB-dependent SusC/RagA subfamily outer membrane receptor